MFKLTSSLTHWEVCSGRYAHGRREHLQVPESQESPENKQPKYTFQNVLVIVCMNYRLLIVSQYIAYALLRAYIFWAWRIHHGVVNVEPAVSRMSVEPAVM